jgi:23S rRNA pseudouridine1911/1915/1917 synthase
VSRSRTIELDDGAIVIPILYEDRSVLALDKPAGWMLAPDSWDQTGRNLQLALQSSLNAGDFWARSRNLKFLRFIHRLDAETTGIVLFAKSPGALTAYSGMFESRLVEKIYLAVVTGVPKESLWICREPLMPDPRAKGRMVPARKGAGNFKEAETHFQVLKSLKKTSLVEARPVTGRTHQIRVHLSLAGHPVVGDPLYGSAPPAKSKGRQHLALRAVEISYRDPFQKIPIRIEAPAADFLRKYGFAESSPAPSSPTDEP